MERILHYINGEFPPPLNGSYLDNVEPATGRTFSQVPDGDLNDIERAVAAAEGAFEGWSRTSTADRSRVLLKIADLIERNIEPLALAESRDTGKPLSLARSVDIPRAAANFRFFGSAILHASSETHVMDHTAINYTLRRPRGVVGVISPWNLPLYVLSWKVAPAMACGNTVVAKPSELTPMTAYMLSHLCRQADLPGGVLNIVHGRGATAGSALVRHPRVSTISFTGGTVTGREIAQVTGPMFKRLALELGGKNPTIVFSDVDLDHVVPETILASFANQGQVCLCGSRVLVERSAYPVFVDRFVSAAQALRVGDPLEPTTDQGALVSSGHREKVLSYIRLAIDEGGDLLCGGVDLPELPERCRGGSFVRPTVFTGLNASCRVNREEIFGPVASIIPFDDEEEVVRLANSTDYGLSASVWTRDIQRAHRVAEGIQAGTVWVNCWMLRDLRVPFGGMKQSGVGREGGLEAMRFFTEPKNVCVKM